jgi:hypothetical protein
METDTTIWTFHLLSQIAQVVEDILFDGKPVEKEHSNDMLEILKNIDKQGSVYCNRLISINSKML